MLQESKDGPLLPLVLFLLIQRETFLAKLLALNLRNLVIVIVFVTLSLSLPLSLLHCHYLCHCQASGFEPVHLGQVLHQLVPVRGDILAVGEDAGEGRAGDVVHPVLETLAHHLAWFA